MSLANKFTKAYGADVFEVKLLSASQLDLVVMVYDAAITAIANAEAAMQVRNIQRRTERINRAIDYIECLRAGLDHDHGGDISKNLNMLYLYMRAQLCAANAKNDSAICAEVIKLLQDLREAWQQLAANNASKEAVTDAPPPAAVAGGLSYGKI